MLIWQKNTNKLKNRFLKKSENLSYEQLNRVPQDNGWSAAQVLFHCNLVETATFDMIRKKRVKSDSDLKSRFRSAILVVFLRLPFLKFKAPKQVSEVPTEISYSAIKTSFENSSSDSKELLLEIPEEFEKKYIFKHPSVELLNIHQTLKFLNAHYLHHEKQLDALLWKKHRIAV